MKTIDIELSGIYGFLSPCRFQGFIHEGKISSSVLVFPGGGYHFVSGREAEPVAMRFFEKGFNAFILTYSTKDRSADNYPMQLLQAEAAVLYIRGLKEYCNNNVITCGFSAGGHLAGMTAAYYDRECVLKAFNVNADEAKPSAAILSYPVVSSVANPHVDSFKNLTGSDNPKDYINFSLEFAINKDTPPVFIWHTANDTCVNINNSITLSAALTKNGVPFEMHIFEDGVHGLSMCDETTSVGNPALIRPDVAVWFDLCVTWLKKRF